MKSELERFHLDSSGKIEYCPDGDFVLYELHKKVVSQLEDQIKQLENGNRFLFEQVKALLLR